MIQNYKLYPQLRFMGNKYRLLPWIEETLTPLDFSSVLDAFSGSGSVSYLLKTMGKQVFSKDFLNFPMILSRAAVENSSVTVTREEVQLLCREASAPGVSTGNAGAACSASPGGSASPGDSGGFIRRTFEGVFFNPEDLSFLDTITSRLPLLDNPHKQALVKSALIRSCVKKQPRGVFTISGDLSRYDDGRRDLKLSLAEHLSEQIEIYNGAVFDNRRENRAFCGSVFDFDYDAFKPDLVYMDPPYVPRSDDNCYIKRYHFLEGLSKNWEGEEILYNTKVKKIPKKYTPFSYRKDAVDAFDRMFAKFRESTLVLSYSSNGFPDLEVLTELMGRYKSRIEVKEKDHRYHFGTHDRVKRAKVSEYLIIGR
ncbi:MAG: DNA adenine methylase [Spirochaetales bacterium]|nr:DNA adenine methylase [Spirochaetales bacterium]